MSDNRGGLSIHNEFAAIIERDGEWFVRLGCFWCRKVKPGKIDRYALDL